MQMQTAQTMTEASLVKTVKPERDFIEVRDGQLSFNPHEGQARALISQKRIVAIISGSQAGKTVCGPVWLLEEMKRRGPGDYMIVTPTYQILEKKALPEVKKLFDDVDGLLRIGRYVQSPARQFRVSRAGEKALFGATQTTKTTIHFGYAEDPESLESATLKGVWIDEGGQVKFRLASYEAILRRLSIHQGRILISTTPYAWNWLYYRIYHPWVQSGRNHPEIDVIEFESIMNPSFPRAEFERRRLEMQPWKFDMMYRGKFTRPAGLIYDCFDPKIHVIARRDVPADWPRHLGIDFGGINTAAVFFCRNPTNGALTAYKEYHPKFSRTATEHARHLLEDETHLPTCAGGASGEGQWRQEFLQAGLVVDRPRISDLGVGIDRVYSAIRGGKLFVFDDLHGLIEEFNSYARETDDAGEVMDKIHDKESFHLLDAVRYAVADLSFLQASSPSWDGPKMPTLKERFEKRKGERKSKPQESYFPVSRRRRYFHKDVAARSSLDDE